MNIRSIVAISLAALTLTVGLTGCIGGNVEEPDTLNGAPQEAPTAPVEYTTVYNTTNGYVVKVTEKTKGAESEVIYVDPAFDTLDAQQFLTITGLNEPFRNVDIGTTPLVPPGSAGDNSLTVSINSLIDINAKPYPAESSVYGVMRFETVDEVVAYYNANVSQPIVNQEDVWNAGTLSDAVSRHAYKAIDAAAQQVVSFSLDGQVEIREASSVAADQANGVPAWQAYRNMLSNNVLTSYSDPSSNTSSDNPPPPVPSDKGNPAPINPVYLYLYTCATYGVQISEAESTLAQINGLLDDHIEVLELKQTTRSIQTETDAPCEVIKYNG